jgi:hypothetical protein
MNMVYPYAGVKLRYGKKVRAEKAVVIRAPTLCSDTVPAAVQLWGFIAKSSTPLMPSAAVITSDW